MMEQRPGGSEEHWCEQLYSAKAAELILYGRALGLSHSEAEDVLQEVFIELLGRVAAPLQPGHYCVRAFRNRAMNHHRGLWRRLKRELESRSWFEPGEGESELERRAMQQLKRLPVEQREVIVLKVWHGHTFEEIGELQAISPNTAAGRYRYGLQRIRAVLEATSDHESTLGKPFSILDTASS